MQNCLHSWAFLTQIWLKYTCLTWLIIINAIFQYLYTILGLLAVVPFKFLQNACSTFLYPNKKHLQVLITASAVVGVQAAWCVLAQKCQLFRFPLIHFYKTLYYMMNRNHCYTPRKVQTVEVISLTGTPTKKTILESWTASGLCYSDWQVTESCCQQQLVLFCPQSRMLSAWSTLTWALTN